MTGKRTQVIHGEKNRTENDRRKNILHDSRCKNSVSFLQTKLILWKNTMNFHGSLVMRDAGIEAKSPSSLRKGFRKKSVFLFLFCLTFSFLHHVLEEDAHRVWEWLWRYHKREMTASKSKQVKGDDGKKYTKGLSIWWSWFACDDRIIITDKENVGKPFSFLLPSMSWEAARHDVLSHPVVLISKVIYKALPVSQGNQN
jgi:hypothetical protein